MILDQKSPNYSKNGRNCAGNQNLTTSPSYQNFTCRAFLCQYTLYRDSAPPTIPDSPPPSPPSDTKDNSYTPTLSKPPAKPSTPAHTPNMFDCYSYKHDAISPLPCKRQFERRRSIDSTTPIDTIVCSEGLHSSNFHRGLTYNYATPASLDFAKLTPKVQGPKKK